jgi:thioredoxin 2
MGPQFAAAAEMLKPDIRLLKLNSDAGPEAAGRLGVSGIPALFLIRHGEIVAGTAGAMSANQIVSWTRQALGRRSAGGQAA